MRTVSLKKISALQSLAGDGCSRRPSSCGGFIFLSGVKHFIPEPIKTDNVCNLKFRSGGDQRDFNKNNGVMGVLESLKVNFPRFFDCRNDKNTMMSTC